MTPGARSSAAQICTIGAWLCLAGVSAPLALIWLMGIASPAAFTLIPLTAFSVASAAIGLLLCGLSFYSSRTFQPKLLALLILLPGGLSLLLLAEGLRENSFYTDLDFCGVVEREGRTVRRGENGYKARLDQDGDGVACEPVLGPGCYRGRCVPFG